jgi:hypothetical protein
MSSRTERALIKTSAAYEKAKETYTNTHSEWVIASEAKYIAKTAFLESETRENRAAFKNAEKLLDALYDLRVRHAKEMIALEKLAALKRRQHEEFLERKAWRDGAAARQAARQKAKA